MSSVGNSNPFPAAPGTPASLEAMLKSRIPGDAESLVKACEENTAGGRNALLQGLQLSTQAPDEDVFIALRGKAAAAFGDQVPEVKEFTPIQLLMSAGLKGQKDFQEWIRVVVLGKKPNA